MPLGHLMVFEAMYEHRNVSVVARMWSVPQPTLSRWLSQLRQHFDDPLFVRTRTGMEPTPLATRIAPSISEMLSIYREKVRAELVFDPSKSTRTFNLATSDFGQALFIPPLYKALLDRAPGIKIRGVTLGHKSLVDQLESGEVDIAIGGFPALSSGIMAQTLLRETYVCAVRYDNPVLSKPFDIEAFRDCNHVLVAAHEFSHAHQLAEQRLLEICQPERIKIATESFLVSAIVAEQTDVVLTVPERTGQWFAQHNTLKILPVPFDLPDIEVKQYWHERYHKDPGNAWLRKVIFGLN